MRILRLREKDGRAALPMTAFKADIGATVNLRFRDTIACRHGAKMF
jgi:hypothetical protein